MTSRRPALAVAAVLLAVGALLLWLLRAGADGEGAQAPQRSSAVTAPESAPAEPPHFAADAPALPLEPLSSDPAAPAESAPTATTGRLLVLVTWADGKPAPSIATAAVFWDTPEPLFHQREGVTDATGRWEVPDCPPGKVGVYLDRADGDQTQVKAGEASELHLVIPPGVLVRGLVVDADERAVPGAQVWLSPGNPSGGSAVAQADAAGRFTLRDMRENNEIGARADGHLPSPLVRVRDSDAHVQDVTLRLGGAGAALQGRVLDAQGAPVAGALVIVGPETGWPAPDENNRLAVSGPPARRLRADAQGAFSVRDLPRGQTPLAARGRGHSPWIGTCDLQTGATAQVDIVLPDSAVASGIVADEDGHPIANVRVTSGAYIRIDWVETRSAADGRYELADLALGTQRLSAALKGGGKDETQLEVVAGARLAWNPRLTRGLQIVGRVLDASESPVPGLHVDAICYLPSRTAQAQATTDAQGRFTLDNCGDGANDLSAYDPSWKTLVALQKGVRPGPEEVVLHLLPDAPPSAFLIGRVVDARGGVPELTTVFVVDATTGRGQLEGLDPGTGDFRCGPLHPGDWDLLLVSQGRPQAKVGRFTLLANETRDVGTFTLPEPGRVVVQVRLGAGVTIDRVYCDMRPKDANAGRALQLQEGTAPVWVSESLEPGDYVVTLGSGSGGADDVFVVPAQASARVEAGRDTTVDLFAERGTALSIRVRTQRAEPPPTTVIVTDAAGAELLHRSVYWNKPRPGRAESEGTVSLVGRPGPCRLRVESEGKRVLEQELGIPAGVNIGPDVSVSVP